MEITLNWRRIFGQFIERSPACVSGRVILVYGDLCLGPNNEMKKLADEYGATKVDGVNCVDCLLGGKGKFFDVNPTHELLFLPPGINTGLHAP